MSVDLGSRRITRFFAGVCVLLALATVYSIMELRRDFDASEKQRRVSEKKQAATAQIAGRLSEQVSKLGADPVVPKSEIEKISGEEGTSGRPPSSAEVSEAVARFCSLGACDGKDATVAQVSAAVSLYCSERGNCKGSKGAPGEDGKSPSASQVASSVATYCVTRNMCMGPPGEKGDVGERGAVGDKGDKGEAGPTGPAGEKGAKGDPGVLQNVVVSDSCASGPFASIQASEPVVGIVTITCTPVAPRTTTASPVP